MSKGVTKRSEDYAGWYNDLVKKAGLAEHSSVRGCMVIKPHGYAIWEKMQSVLDGMFKATGHSNVYFPIFIPKSNLSREAQHVEGFAKECAVVTHYRLKSEADDLIVDPASKLEEPLIVRPTSETVIWSTYKNWIKSYRDLPLLYNQWANVVRWEMRTRLFLRTSEFLWQEGHTAHATAAEAIAETKQMLQIYTDFVQDYMAIPVIQGLKTEQERFPGAIDTYSIEAQMQDGKALQVGTSHFLGQNFAKAFEVQFAAKTGGLEYVWGTSWGVSTRLMGALIMAHGDDKGLVLPPKLAPFQVVIVPIQRGRESLDRIKTFYETNLKDKLTQTGLKVHEDWRDTHKPGFKFAHWEMLGIPIRLTIGERDIANGQIEITRRASGEKILVGIEDVSKTVDYITKSFQKELFSNAQKTLQNNTSAVDDFGTFKELINSKKGGFILAHWDGTTETELKIKAETKATIRCIPLDSPLEEGKCIYTGRPSKRRVLFAKAY